MKITTKEIIKFINENRQIMPESIKEKQNNYWKCPDYEARKKIIFICTWQDSLYNLARVLKIVFEKLNCLEDPNFCFFYNSPVGYRSRKGRKDIYIITSDNLLFRKVFYSLVN